MLKKECLKSSGYWRVIFEMKIKSNKIVWVPSKSFSCWKRLSNSKDFSERWNLILLLLHFMLFTLVSQNVCYNSLQVVGLINIVDYKAKALEHGKNIIFHLKWWLGRKWIGSHPNDIKQITGSYSRGNQTFGIRQQIKWLWTCIPTI